MAQFRRPASSLGRPPRPQVVSSLFSLLFVLLLSSLLASCSSPKPLRIGYLGTLGGRTSDLGIRGLYGARLAVNERNASGGIAGQKIELIEEDDHHEPEAAGRAFHRLAEKGVVAIIGPMTSAIAQTLLPHANELRIPLLSPTASGAQLSGIDDYFLRITPSARDFATTTADYLAAKPSIRRIRPIIDLNNAAYSRSWLRDFSTAFNAKGGTLLDPIQFTADDLTDFDALARRALDGNPDGILMIASSFDMAMVCQSLRKYNHATLLFASESAGSERLIELGGRFVEGVHIPQSFDRNNSSSAYSQFRSAYVKAYGKEPGRAGTNAYDATTIILDLLATGTPPSELKQAILARRQFQGRQHSIIFDAYGDSTATTRMTVVRQGKFVRDEP